MQQKYRMPQVVPSVKSKNREFTNFLQLTRQGTTVSANDAYIVTEIGQHRQGTLKETGTDVQSDK